MTKVDALEGGEDPKELLLRSREVLGWRCSISST
jgi:hypothetical protein